MDPISIVNALTKFAFTPLGLLLTVLISGWAALRLDRRYAKSTDVETIVKSWNLKAESLEETSKRIIENEGTVHEKINLVANRVSLIEGACKVRHGGKNP